MGCNSKLLSPVKTGGYPLDRGIYPMTTGIKLYLCFWTIPTVGFYRKHGEVTSPPSSQNYLTLLLSAYMRRAGGMVVVDVTMTASPPPPSAVGLSCQYWINLESIWLWSLLWSRREDDGNILGLCGTHQVQCTYKDFFSQYSWQQSLLIERKSVNGDELQSIINTPSEVWCHNCDRFCLSIFIRKGQDQR